MVSIVARPSRAKQRLEQARDWLLRHRAAEKLFILTMCLVYVMHNIWLARTVLWFLVVPVMLIATAPYRNLLPILKSGVFLASAVFLLLIIGTSVLGGETPASLLFKNLRYAAAVLAFVVIVAALTREDGDFLRLLFLFLAPVSALTAIRDVVSFSGLSLDTLLTARLQGVKGLTVYYNSNVIGMMFAMPCVGAAAVMASRALKRWQFVMLSVSVLILLFAIVLTGSRGSLIAATVGIGVSILASANWRLSAVIAGLVGVAACVTLMTPLAGELLQRRDSLRLTLWPVYLEMAMLKPWLGYGLAFDTQRTLPDGNVVMNGHNIFLCALVRGGVLSALALVGIVLTSLASALRAWLRSGEVLALALLATCLTATTVDYEIIPTDLAYLYVLFWLPAGICIGASLATARRQFQDNAAGRQSRQPPCQETASGPVLSLQAGLSYLSAIISSHRDVSGVAMTTHRPIRILAIAAAAAFTYLLSAALPAAAAEPTAAGLWQRTDNGKAGGKPVVWVLMIDRGNNVYEGVVARTFTQPGQSNLTVCDECDDDRKNQPILGISLIRDMKRKGRVYEGGNILDPRNGDVWKAMLTVSPDGQTLTLRGYLMTPALGKDEDWFRLPDTAIAQLDPEIVAKYMPEHAADLAAKPGAPATVGKPKAPAPMQKGMMAPAK